MRGGFISRRCPAKPLLPLAATPLPRRSHVAVYRDRSFAASGGRIVAFRGPAPLRQLRWSPLPGAAGGGAA